MTVQLIVVAIVMLLVGVAALYRQSRAASCPKHNRWAGRIGVILAWISLIAGVALLGYAAVLYRTNFDAVSP